MWQQSVLTTRSDTAQVSLGAGTNPATPGRTELTLPDVYLLQNFPVLFPCVFLTVFLHCTKKPAEFTQGTDLTGQF